MRIIAGDKIADKIDKIYINGVRFEGSVVEFDTEENWARCFIKDEDGLFVKAPCGMRHKIEMRLGVVTYTVRKE